jgi:hypothetical protein
MIHPQAGHLLALGDPKSRVSPDAKPNAINQLIASINYQDLAAF